MELEQLRQDILSWSENFVERPHPALGGWALCPFARSARLKNTVGIFVGVDPCYDLKNRSNQGMGSYEVAIYAYDPAEWNYELFSSSLEQANQDFLIIWYQKIKCTATELPAAKWVFVVLQTCLNG
jgi:hypothetical protein